MKLQLLAAIAAAAVATGVHISLATTYAFDTTNGQMAVGGGTATGGTMVSQLTSQGAVFLFSGNVTFNPGDTISVSGNAPLIIESYNDINLGSGVTINVSADGFSAGPGGGNGGAGGSGGFGGTGGNPPAGNSANNGGAGGGGGGIGQGGGSGAPGAAGAAYAGSPGTSGGNGTSGVGGSNGYGSTIGAGLAGTGGANLGLGGAVGLSGNPGSGGAGGTFGQQSTSGSYGGGGGGGKPGYAGVIGASGTNGVNGGNIAEPNSLTGGAGGGGGGGGQGGGGGGTGGVGGGAGGGGGGGGTLVSTGAGGGNGGAGGLGGIGGNGGNGGAGGQGGGGGGAIELYAHGRLTVDGSILATGAAGTSGTQGTAGTPGAAGGSGLLGAAGGSGSSVQAGGGNGGNGGAGGNGGDGGAGGYGGTGGAGSGGTIELTGSSVNAAYGVFDTLGGTFSASSSNASLNNATNGRFFVQTNTQITSLPDAIGAAPQYGSGPSGSNPYLQQGNSAVSTPNIPDLAGGVAAPYGILANLHANSSALTGLATDAPAHALAAVLLGSSGLPGYSDVFPGYQWVFVVNLSGNSINGLKIGLSSTSTTFASALMQQTLAITGSGSTGSINILSSSGVPLPGNDVYAFLAPTSIIDSGTLYATANGALPLTMTSDYGLVTPGFLPIGYLQSTVATPEPATWSMALAALGGLALSVKRRRPAP